MNWPVPSGPTAKCGFLKTAGMIYINEEYFLTKTTCLAGLQGLYAFGPVEIFWFSFFNGQAPVLPLNILPAWSPCMAGIMCQLAIDGIYNDQRFFTDIDRFSRSFSVSDSSAPMKQFQPCSHRSVIVHATGVVLQNSASRCRQSFHRRWLKISPAAQHVTCHV